MLKIDFYESGIGETTIITFPDDSIGILDAFPSDCSSRPDILSLTAGKKINFVCLSHPHDDHSRDLSPIIQSGNPEEFWNTVRSTPLFFYGLTDYNKYKSTVNDHLVKHRVEAVESLISLFNAALKRKIPQLKICAEHKPVQIAGVDVFFLAPNEKTLSQFEYAFQNWNKETSSSLPDFNEISSVIAFRYGESVFIHGGDAIAKQWITAYDEFFKNKLQRSILMKIPHHGAKNSLTSSSKIDNRSKYNYLKLFEPDAHLVIFGNSTHPNQEVWAELRNKSKNILFLLNKYRPHHDENPLRIPGGRLKNSSKKKIMCNSVVHVEMDEHGGIAVNPGTPCRNCGIQNSCIPQS